MSPYEIIFGCKLTQRELTICVGVARFKTPTEIAFELSVTRRSIHKYEQRIRTKIGVRNRSDLIRRLQPTIRRPAAAP